MLLSEDMEASAERLTAGSGQVVCNEATVAFDLLKRLTSRWKWRRRVQTNWPIVPLATYCLVLDKHCSVSGRRERVIKMVAHAAQLAEDTIEGLLHQDILEVNGSWPLALTKGEER